MDAAGAGWAAGCGAGRAADGRRCWWSPAPVAAACFPCGPSASVFRAFARSARSRCLACSAARRVFWSSALRVRSARAWAARRYAAGVGVDRAAGSSRGRRPLRSRAAGGPPARWPARSPRSRTGAAVRRAPRAVRRAPRACGAASSPAGRAVRAPPPGPAPVRLSAPRRATRHRHGRASARRPAARRPGPSCASDTRRWRRWPPRRPPVRAGRGVRRAARRRRHRQPTLRRPRRAAEFCEGAANGGGVHVAWPEIYRVYGRLGGPPGNLFPAGDLAAPERASASVAGSPKRSAEARKALSGRPIPVQSGARSCRVPPYFLIKPLDCR